MPGSGVGTSSGGFSGTGGCPGVATADICTPDCVAEKSSSLFTSRVSIQRGYAAKRSCCML